MIGKAGVFCRRIFSVETQYFLLGSGANASAISGARVFPSGVPLSASVAAAPAFDTLGTATTVDDLSAAGSAYGPTRSAFLVVFGAGLSVVNGVYIAGGTFGGRTAYGNAQTGTSIVWRGADWYLSAGGFGDAYEFGSGDVPGAAELLYPNGLPPLGEPLYPPAPAVVFFPQQTDPDLHGGRIVLTYPAAIPALTVSGGLTFTETAVGSNRQYEFTAGSGTITFP